MTGMVFDIQRFCVHDGPGIRTTVFLKGCPLRCLWCHNPEGLSPRQQVQFLSRECIGCLRCGGQRTPSAAARCPSGALKVVGRAVSPEELLEQVLADRDFYGTEGGVTFSGGECLLQAPFVVCMLEKLRDQGITTAVDTCGCVPWEALQSTLGLCGTYLYDVKCADPDLHRAVTGRDNRLILDNLSRLSLHGARLWIRIPVIPGINDSDAEMRAIAQIVNPLAGVQKVTLMPYHTLGKSKYETLGMTAGYDAPGAVSAERLRQLQELFPRAERTTP